ncbi:acyl-CoA N-acyltransferase [Lindgomyces ingoldianus]|uniref:Acyl-CoA N-acyltransferase n=1 Tax=Lindgomyces ingoldianus TaxID=673940 RepID=A0ACB6Q8N1_9PLEO|nr:acyl-CoA N-acyltransferase [Lindgomyces ingoldianus]KAF2463394.1 acyl-CoA N-acyltransferase [Lindgomyces ingoldianus]
MIRHLLKLTWGYRRAQECWETCWLLSTRILGSCQRRKVNFGGGSLAIFWIRSSALLGSECGLGVCSTRLWDLLGSEGNIEILTQYHGSNPHQQDQRSDPCWASLGTKRRTFPPSLFVAPSLFTALLCLFLPTIATVSSSHSKKQPFTIRLAIPADISHLAAIEDRYTTKFRSEANVEAYGPCEATLHGFRAMDCLWVAVPSSPSALAPSEASPIGYIAIDSFYNDLDNENAASVYINQVSVDPGFGGQGVGRQLVSHVEGWMTGMGYYWLDLTTFRDVPWNCAWYERLGFQVLSDVELEDSSYSDLRDELHKNNARLRADDRVDGYALVAMRKMVGAPPPREASRYRDESDPLYYLDYPDSLPLWDDETP